MAVAGLAGAAAFSWVPYKGRGCIQSLSERSQYTHITRKPEILRR